MFGLSSQPKPVLLSGIQASGRLHFGNYFAAVKPNIELANSGEFAPYIFVADYHALTTVINKEDIKRGTF
jgi:tryptophanyl-tRNA synthetase